MAEDPDRPDEPTEVAPGAGAEPRDGITETVEAGAPELDERVGPYRLIREIGRGGMGTVYLAARADAEFHKRVALKVVSAGTDRAEVIRRFRRERQILASLEHPNIARLLDGGATADGKPYFVMEYIEGLRLDEYCDRKRLSMAERLRLFRQVCSAVQYAHRNLVVHRDVKPRNVLVTPSGIPKLLDFGIAKLLNPEVWGEDAQTATGMGPFTPEYASPEQVRGESITTATDVYALGVVLYLLLTGRLPYRLATRQPLEVFKAVTEQEPERPSLAVLRPRQDADPEDTSPESIGARRDASPRGLRSRLRGDLDTILLTALQKEPDRRYSSVEAFSEDLGRHLEGLPVRARRPRLSYRALKFAARNRVAVVVSAAVLSLLLGSWIALAVQSSRLARERDRVAGEAAKAEAVSGFLQSMLASADPFEGVGRDVTVLEVLERSVGEIDESFADQPEIRAALQTTIGETYQRLGRYDVAEELLSAALATRRGLLGDDHLDVAETLAELGTVHNQRGDHAEAETLYREALGIRRRQLGTRHLDVAKTLDQVATQLQYQGQDDEAERLFREALAIYRELLEGDRSELADSLNNLAMLLNEKGDYAASEPLYLESLAMYRNLLGDRHPSLAVILSNFGNLLVDRGEYAESQPYFEEACDIFERALGADHWMLAHARSNHAVSLIHLGRDDEAEALLVAALAVLEAELGADHQRTRTAASRLRELRQAR